jgi:hypothetical protein
MKKFAPAITLPSSLLIDPTKEPLHVILDPYKGITHVPSDLASSASPGLFVFTELNRCFDRQGKVSEGLLANVIWGFNQCGHDQATVGQGLAELRSKGYISYSDARGNPISETNFDPQKPIWIRYTEKFKKIFVKEGPVHILRLPTFAPTTKPAE